MKAGIRYLSERPDTETLTLAFDNDAALACKSITKDATRHYAVYTREMGRLHELQNYVRENLDKALENHHIKVYCQPIVRSLNGKVCSFEALARWDSPEYGLLSPALFIPTLEEFRLIDRLDRYVADQMAQFLHNQMKRGQQPLPVSLNFSRLDFQLMDPAQMLEETLSQYQLPRDFLCPEVTENALVLQDESIRQGLRRFWEAGFEVWLDDFGSGYSSLNVLKDYRFHTLKLDMAFLHPFTKESRIILTSIVRMAKELGIHTLAEGVETKEQADFLRDIGCEKLQGYYFGKPLPLEECLPFCQDRDLSFESLQEAVLLNRAGLIDVSQSSPVAIVADDSQNVQFLQINDAYLKSLQSIGTKNLPGHGHGRPALRRHISPVWGRLHGRSYRRTRIRRYRPDLWARISPAPAPENHRYPQGISSTVPYDFPYRKLLFPVVPEIGSYRIAPAGPYPDIQRYPRHPAGRRLPLHALHAYAIVQGAEARSLDSLLQLLIKRMHESEEAKYGQALYTSDRFIFNRKAFDDDELGVVVSDPETYELLYCNPTMRKCSGIPLDAPLEGRKCYEMMAGLSAPCTDCCHPRLSRSRFTSRIFHNPVAGMDFLLRDILIPWHGKNCHFCTCLNLDEYLTKDTRFNQMLFFEASVNDAIRPGMYETDPVRGIRQMMSRIGRQLEADRIILAEEKGDNVTFTYTWEADGILPLGEDFQPISRVELRHIFDHFSQGNSFTIPDMAAYWQEHPNLAPHIPGIQRLALARLMLDGQPYGFITVINPSPEKLHQAEELLTALTRFFTILLRNRDMTQRLDRLSKSDQLTGLLNRRGFKDCLASLPEGRRFAFIFGDLNELKENNDTLEHEAGDQLLCAAAEIFLHVGHEDFIFRMGGDEFLMVEEIQQPQEAQVLLKKLQEHFQVAHISIALGVTTTETPIEDIDAILTQADILMYRQKIQQHRVTPDA